MTETVLLPDVNLAYEPSGPSDGMPVVAVHGWPDTVACWDSVLPALHDGGCRVFRPWLRGFGPTRLREGSVRTGQIVALAQDLSHFLEVLDLHEVVLAGHDWGARAGYALAALWPQRLRGLVSMSVGYGATGPDATMTPAQAHAYWYQWFFATAYGRRRLEADRRSLCRYLWRTWSPTWQFSDNEFDTAAAAFDNPDWIDITVHSYAQRWGEQVGDPAVAEIESRVVEHIPIAVPTVVLHGELDMATLPDASAGKERYFRGPYERRTLAGVGHFVPREAPEVVSATILGLVRPSS